jgi:hypothetical protein
MPINNNKKKSLFPSLLPSKLNIQLFCKNIMKAFQFVVIISDEAVIKHVFVSFMELET